MMKLTQLRQTLRALEKPPVLGDGPDALPLGIDSIDAVLGGGLARGALHEIAAPGEAHLTTATGFALGLAASSSALLSRASRVCWIAEDMAQAESGAPYGGGLAAFGLSPERLITVTAAKSHDLLWAMEEALRCRAMAAVIGEWRHGSLDAVTARRLSLAATEGGTPGLFLRAAPVNDASTAVTRWIVGAAASAATAHGPGSPRFAAQLVRNRRGPLGSWILQWSNDDERFLLAHAQPLAVPAFHRPHHSHARKIA